MYLGSFYAYLFPNYTLLLPNQYAAKKTANNRLEDRRNVNYETC